MAGLKSMAYGTICVDDRMASNERIGAYCSWRIDIIRVEVIIVGRFANDTIIRYDGIIADAYVIINRWIVTNFYIVANDGVRANKDISIVKLHVR